MGAVGAAVRRMEECAAVGDLRTRLRCARVGVSRPEDLCHLIRGVEFGVSEWGGFDYLNAEVMCRGSGMSTAQACTVVLAIGHQETRVGARDMLTCADGLGCLLIVFVRGELHSGEGEVVVGQDLVRVGRSLQNVVWCFTNEGSGKPAATSIGEFGAAIRPWFLGRETGSVAITDAELFIGLYSPCGGESDGLCGRIDGIRNVRSVGAVEEGAYDGIIRWPLSITAKRTKTQGECHSPVLPPERMTV